MNRARTIKVLQTQITSFVFVTIVIIHDHCNTCTTCGAHLTRAAGHDHVVVVFFVRGLGVID